MAPRRKPTVAKDLRGTNRADRANPNEPKYRAAAPPMPDWLTSESQEIWKTLVAELERARVLTPVYMGVMASYCEMVAEVAGYTRRLERGDSFLDEEKRKYPLAKERRDAIQRLGLLAGELGLSPASLSKVSSIGDAGKADPMAPQDRAPRPQRKQAEPVVM